MRVEFIISIIFEKMRMIKKDSLEFPFQYDCDLLIQQGNNLSDTFLYIISVKRVSGEDFTDCPINRNDRYKFQSGRKSLKLEAQDR